MSKAIFDERASIIFQARKHGVGVEIGVHKGEFSQQILKFAQPKKLF